MFLSISKFIVAMMYTIMFFVSQINKAVVATPGIRVNDAFWFYFAANDGLQGFASAIGNNLCVDLAASLEKTKNRCFTISATPTFSFDAMGPEV